MYCHAYVYEMKFLEEISTDVSSAGEEEIHSTPSNKVKKPAKEVSENIPILQLNGKKNKKHKQNNACTHTHSLTNKQTEPFL